MVLLLFLFPLLVWGQKEQIDSLETTFLNPPVSTSAWTWWHWMNGNVSKEGITADLESMKRIGIGGLYNFHIGHQLPFNGPVAFMSPQWYELSKFAVQEADRLNLQFGFHNCPGWSTSENPEVTVDQSMQKLVWSETRVDGPVFYRQNLLQPVIAPVYNYYKDILVLAFKNTPDSIIKKVSVIDISAFMDLSGMLR